MALEELFTEVDGRRRVSHQALAKLSGLSKSQILDFRHAWRTVEREGRLGIVRSLIDLAEDNVELDYNDLFLAVLDDPDAEVRVLAVEGLLEDERRSTADKLLLLSLTDPDETVRAAAVGSLGRWVLEIELGNLEGAWADRLADAVLRIAESDEISPAVRRRAVEAAGCLSSPRAVAMIRVAYQHVDPRMRASAVFAMGRNCDDQWLPTLLEELTSESAELRFEAARALGELEDRRAVPTLVEATRDADREVRLAAIAALGKAGGRVARQALLALRHGAHDGVIRTAVDEALEELASAEDPLGVRVADPHPN